MTATLTDSILETGWSFLEIHDKRMQEKNITSSLNLTDEDIAYLAGYMEAYLTHSLMDNHWQNTMSNFCTSDPEMEELCRKLIYFIFENIAYITDKNLTDPLWYQVRLFEFQSIGLAHGYSDMGSGIIADIFFQLFQLYGDLDDLIAALSSEDDSDSNQTRPPTTPRTRVTGSGSCSALVKVLADQTDLLIGHNTWTHYANMLRIYKLYDLKFQKSSTDTSIIPGHTLAFPSYPTRLYSGDDFYITSAGLVTMETSIENSNPDLWKYITPECIFENMRVMAANRLASSGAEWVSIFGRENSGTYNNEWMVVDMKLFDTVGELKDGLLWVLEQMPDHIESEDMTHMLRDRSYWPSYNIPYFKDIYEISGTADLAKKYGDWFTWEGAPRAKIFARHHSDVTDLESLMTLMEYNDFKHDDLSVCNCTPPYSGENAIAARSDLNPPDGMYPFSALGHRLHGAIDMKVTSAKLLASAPLAAYASSGPTHSQQPPFQWSTSGNPFGIPKGHPDRWYFKPQLIRWDYNQTETMT